MPRARRRRRAATVLAAAAAAAVTVVMGSAACSSGEAATPAQPERWIPAPGTSWQVQYKGPIDTSVDAMVLDLDGEDTSPDQVRALKQKGKRVLCYINAGAWENWRSDQAAFPPGVLGGKMPDWQNERWLDIRRLDVLMPIMTARMDMCRSKGFDGVDPDNVDGWTNKSGFPLVLNDAKLYVEALAKAAHERGLSLGLKNSVALVSQVAGTVDFAVNEQCMQYRECDAYQPMVSAGKAVFHVEYKGDPAQICRTRPAGFSTIIKKPELNAERHSCP